PSTAAHAANAECAEAQGRAARLRQELAEAENQVAEFASRVPILSHERDIDDLLRQPDTTMDLSR
ncbi:hypothetical protein PHISP_07922, partial [Aspergillus sp. HF37]